jgi:hypothetical protein
MEEKQYLPSLRRIPPLHTSRNDLVDHFFADYPVYDSEENTLEHMSSIGNIKAVKDIIENKEYTCNESVNDSVIRAAENGHLNVVMYLITYHQKTCGYIFPFSALEEAARNGYLNVVKYLAPLIHGEKKYDSAMHAAIENGHLDVVKYLLSMGASFNNVSTKDAFENGHLDMAQYLSSSVHDDYLLPIAADEGNLEVVIALLSMGADVNALSGLALENAIKNKDLEMVEFLTSHGANVNLNDNNALIEAVELNALHIALLLIENGADIRARYDEAFYIIRSHNRQFSKEMDYIEELICMDDDNLDKQIRSNILDLIRNLCNTTDH